MKLSHVLLVCAGATGVATEVAHGAVTTYAGRVAFGQALAANAWTPVVETFEDETPGLNYGGGMVLDAVTFSRSSSYAGSYMTVTNGANATSGTNTLAVFYPVEGYVSGFLPNDTLVITLPQPVRAFGVSINTAALGPGAQSMFTDVSGEVLSSPDPFVPSQYGQFLGIISDTPFSVVTIRGNAFATYVLDDVTYSVPTPGAAVLLGLCGLVARRRRVS